MRHLRSVSLLITLAGILLVIATPLLPLDMTWLLVGLLLAWAGIVKLVVVALWRNLDRTQ